MTRKALVLFACVLFVATGGCSGPFDDTHKEALDKATASARARATRTLDRLQTDLRTQTLADALNDVVVNDGYMGVTVLNSSTGPSSSFVADLVIVGGGTAGGGMDYKEVQVQMCLRYSGALGADPHVDMADVTCPAGLPSTHYGFAIERTVKLK